MPNSGISISNTFANQAGPIPLSQLDADLSGIANALNALSTFSNYFVDSSGAANQITVTVPGPLVFSYSAGIQLQVKLANTNGLAPTNINVNGLGNKSVSMYNGDDPPPGSLITGGTIILQYDGTVFRVLSPLNAFSRLTLGPGPSGTTLTVNNNTSGSSVTALITSTFGSAAASPLLSLVSTAANGFATFSLAGNSGTPGTNDFALFQNGSNLDGTLINRAAGRNLNLVTGNVLNVTCNGSTTGSFSPTTATIGNSGTANSIGFNTLTQTNIGAAGGASALPATPLGYMTVLVGGAAVKIPYYNP